MPAIQRLTPTFLLSAFLLSASVSAFHPFRSPNIHKRSLRASDAVAQRQYRPRPREIVDTCIALDTNTALRDILNDYLSPDDTNAAIEMSNFQGPLCVCADNLGNFVATDDRARFLLDYISQQQIIDGFNALLGSPAGTECTFPDNSSPVCVEGEPCRFICDENYTQAGAECVCEDPFVNCNGVCDRFPNGCSSAVPRSLKARSSASRKITRDEDAQKTCDDGEMACGVEGGGWECIAVQAQVGSCGGCVTPSPLSGASRTPGGRNCKTIANVLTVNCQSGLCVVESCVDGYQVSSQGDSCILDNDVTAQARTLLEDTIKIIARLTNSSPEYRATCVSDSGSPAAALNPLLRDILDLISRIHSSAETIHTSETNEELVSLVAQLVSKLEVALRVPSIPPDVNVSLQTVLDLAKTLRGKVSALRTALLSCGCSGDENLIVALRGIIGDTGGLSLLRRDVDRCPSGNNGDDSNVNLSVHADILARRVGVSVSSDLEGMLGAVDDLPLGGLLQVIGNIGDDAQLLDQAFGRASAACGCNPSSGSDDVSVCLQKISNRADDVLSDPVATTVIESGNALISQVMECLGLRAVSHNVDLTTSLGSVLSAARGLLADVDVGKRLLDDCGCKDDEKFIRAKAAASTRRPGVQARSGVSVLGSGQLGGGLDVAGVAKVDVAPGVRHAAILSLLTDIAARGKTLSTLDVQLKRTCQSSCSEDVSIVSDLVNDVLLHLTPDLLSVQSCDTLLRRITKLRTSTTVNHVPSRFTKQLRTLNDTAGDLGQDVETLTSQLQECGCSKDSVLVQGARTVFGSELSNRFDARYSLLGLKVGRGVSNVLKTVGLGGLLAAQSTMPPAPLSDSDDEIVAILQNLLNILDITNNIRTVVLKLPASCDCATEKLEDVLRMADDVSDQLVDTLSNLNVKSLDVLDGLLNDLSTSLGQLEGVSSEARSQAVGLVQKDMVLVKRVAASLEKCGCSDNEIVVKGAKVIASGVEPLQ